MWGNYTLEKRISDTLKVPDISLSPYPHFAVRLSIFWECRLADDYNKIVNEFRPLQERSTTDALDAILLDMSHAWVHGKG